MIKAADLIAKFQYALDSNWGYIWGTAGKEWTAYDQAHATREMTVRYGKKWIGHTVADCSGLFRWAYKQLGSDINHSVKWIWRGHLTKHGRLKNGKRTDGKQLLPGSPVFTGETETDHPHIGLYIGGGAVIEAKGTQSGVIKSSVTEKKWTWWGELKEVDYGMTDDNQGFPETSVWRPTLRRGSKGDYVTELQRMLLKCGYSVGTSGIDGDFGKDTMAAVQNFQKDHGLIVDGVAGPMTWDALEKAAETQQKPTKPDTYSVIIRDLDLTQAQAIAAQYVGMAEIVEGSDL
ncbi:MAG: peptidoglycan-binding protein [Oscillospiraceae bacterium]|nr:peptidoglycan-binding protein [Oscillospiraceae bacterium]